MSDCKALARHPRRAPSPASSKFPESPGARFLAQAAAALCRSRARGAAGLLSPRKSYPGWHDGRGVSLAPDPAPISPEPHPGSRVSRQVDCSARLSPHLEIRRASSTEHQCAPYWPGSAPPRSRAPFWLKRNGPRRLVLRPLS
jgi:hypothetical protein